MDFKDMVNYLKKKIARRFIHLYYALPPNNTIHGMKSIKSDYDIDIMYAIAKVAGKIQIYVSHHSIDLSTVLIQNDSSLEEAFTGIISEETKIKQQESLWPEINRLMTLPDHSLIEYGRYALGCMTGADMKKAIYLKMVRDGLLRSMEEKRQLIKNYKEMKQKYQRGKEEETPATITTDILNMKHTLYDDKLDEYYYEMEAEEQKQWKLESEREVMMEAARKQREEHWKELEAIQKLEEEYEEDPELEEEDEDNEYKNFDYDDFYLAYSCEKSPKTPFPHLVDSKLARANTISTNKNQTPMRLDQFPFQMQHVRYSLHVPLKQVNWKLDYKGCYTKEEEATRQWRIEIRLIDSYGNIYLQGFTTKKIGRKLSKYHKLSDIMSPN
nr:oligopeptide transporter [Tanacetum cinerariifolium]